MFSEGVLSDDQPDHTSDRRAGVQNLIAFLVSISAPRHAKGFTHRTGYLYPLNDLVFFGEGRFLTRTVYLMLPGGAGVACMTLAHVSWVASELSKSCTTFITVG